VSFLATLVVDQHSSVPHLLFGIAGTTLQSMTLQLMGSECAEIRERGLRILLLSFSTLDGKVGTALCLTSTSITAPKLFFTLFLTISN
jgi:hypothetical protein